MGCASRTVPRFVPFLCAALLWAGFLPAAYGGDRPGYAGRRLADALDDLRARGLALVYSSDLVRPDMVVTVEPAGGRPRRLLDQLLTPFGLESRDGPGRTVLIVRSAPPAPRDAGAAAGPAGSPAFREEIRVRSRTEEALAGQPEPRES